MKRARGCGPSCRWGWRRGPRGRRAAHLPALLPHVTGLLLVFLGAPPALGQTTPSSSEPWFRIATGLDLGHFRGRWAAPAGDTTIVVLRIDPLHWEPRFLCAVDLGLDKNLTAPEWCEKYDLTAATNAGMFAADYRTHVGYLSCGEHVNNAHWNQYQSVIAFGPRAADLPLCRIFDLDVDPRETILEDYQSIGQNLRLIKRPRTNRWAEQPKMWSEAALAEDDAGRLLLIFSRSPFSMHDFNEILLSLPVGAVCAQHLEGGPEAQLYIRHGDLERLYTGSYETSFNEDDSNRHPWPIPNALGIVARDNACD